MISKPMLAGTASKADLKNLKYPFLVSPKLDGIRCLIHPGLGPVTRSFKGIPNVHIRNELDDYFRDHHFDGELVALGPDGEVLGFNETQSAVMKGTGQPKFRYYVFDCFMKPEEGFTKRLDRARTYGMGTLMSKPKSDCMEVVFLEHVWIHDAEAFIEYAIRALEDGFEGVMIRSEHGPYKSGRSSLKQGDLLKYKEWADAEGVVIGFEEQLHNSNEDVRDNFGRAKRSSAKEGMIPKGTLGKVILQTETWGELRVGSGFDDAQRQEIWENQEAFLNKLVTFKFQEFGMLDKPRFPIFKGFRHKDDTSI